MVDPSRLLFIHGLAGNSQGFKATLLRGLFPGMVIPDFPGDFWERMAKLAAVIGDSTGWTMIGSSMGGLMAAVFACAHPQQVDRLVLLAPALPYVDLDDPRLQPTDVPVTIYHGSRDDLVPLDATRTIAARLFTKFTFYVVDDSHDLTQTVRAIAWPALLGA
jgi:pimeloyl-ACP methyl ester carboxylesterase